MVSLLVDQGFSLVCSYWWNTMSSISQIASLNITVRDLSHSEPSLLVSLALPHRLPIENITSERSPETAHHTPPLTVPQMMAFHTTLLQYIFFTGHLITLTHDLAKQQRSTPSRNPACVIPEKQAILARPCLSRDSCTEELSALRTKAYGEGSDLKCK